MYYKADPQQGVYYYGPVLDDPDTVVLNPEQFYEKLDALDGEITARFGPRDLEWLERIEDEYGIMEA